jgi:hypothetical protein
MNYRQSRLSADTQVKIRELMLGVAGNPVMLYEIVAGGPSHFRIAFLHSFSGLAVDHNVADLIFRFFCEQVARRHPDAESPKVAASQWLDAVEVTSPPTEAEIEASWVHEVFSNEDGRRAAYKDGAGMAGQDHKVLIH